MFIRDGRGSRKGCQNREKWSGGWGWGKGIKIALINVLAVVLYVERVA